MLKICSICGKSNVQWTKETPYQGEHCVEYMYKHDDSTDCRGTVSIRYNKDAELKLPEVAKITQ